MKQMNQTVSELIRPLEISRWLWTALDQKAAIHRPEASRHTPFFTLIALRPE
jgi:hypothetical protein